MAMQPASLDPFSALARAFLERFFENEITAGFDDLKGAFFWMVAALIVPGLFIPWMMSFDWQFIATFKGAAALREAAQAEKVFYLGFAMVASGLLTTIVWSSLLPDRRDTLILGALPVRSSTIVGAKLVALAAYILLVSVSMHAISAIVFGLMLAANASMGFAVRGILAHFVAASAASASVALVVAAAQGVALAVAGPRLFRRLSPVLHGCLVALVAVALASLPIITFSIVHTLRGSGSRMRPWILGTPAVWFLGLYEWLLGTSNPVLLGLARNAGLTLLVALAVTGTDISVGLPAADDVGDRGRAEPRDAGAWRARPSPSHEGGRGRSGGTRGRRFLYGDAHARRAAPRCGRTLARSARRLEPRGMDCVGPGR